MLTTEDSTVMAQENHRSRPVGPQASQTHGVAVNVRKRDAGQPAAERVSHAGILSDGGDGVKGRVESVAHHLTPTPTSADFRFLIGNSRATIKPGSTFDP